MQSFCGFCPIGIRAVLCCVEPQVATFVNLTRDGSAAFWTRFNKLFEGLLKPNLCKSAFQTGYGIIQDKFVDRFDEIIQK